MKLKFVGSLLVLGLILYSGCSLNSDEPIEAPQLQGDLEIIDSYLAEKGIVALKDVNGIRFTVDSIGSGYTPKYTSKVKFDYTGSLLTGSVFQTGSLPSSEITGLITGLQIGLTLIPNGSKATFYIPSDFAYGSQVQPGIPAYSNLIFKVKLKGIIVTDAEKSQRATDIAKIDAFLAQKNITNVVQDTSGLRYVITQVGTGAKPSWLNRVKIVYTGSIINSNNTETKFFTGTHEPNSENDSRVVNFIRGFQIGLQQLQVGGKATFYVPSGMAFGSQTVTSGTVPVPPDSNLVYEIELLEVFAP